MKYFRYFSKVKEYSSTSVAVPWRFGWLRELVTTVGDGGILACPRADPPRAGVPGFGLLGEASIHATIALTERPPFGVVLSSEGRRGGETR